MIRRRVSPPPTPLGRVVLRWRRRDISIRIIGLHARRPAARRRDLHRADGIALAFGQQPGSWASAKVGVRAGCRAPAFRTGTIPPGFAPDMRHLVGAQFEQDRPLFRAEVGPRDQAKVAAGVRARILAGTGARAPKSLLRRSIWLLYQELAPRSARGSPSPNTACGPGSQRSPPGKRARLFQWVTRPSSPFTGRSLSSTYRLPPLYGERLSDPWQDRFWTAWATTALRSIRRRSATSEKSTKGAGAAAPRQLPDLIRKVGTCKSVDRRPGWTRGSGAGGIVDRPPGCPPHPVVPALRMEHPGRAKHQKYNPASRPPPRRLSHGTLK